MSGRVGSRRDPSDGQVTLAVDFAIPLLRRGAGAFIVRVTRSPYLSPLYSLLLTIPLYLTMSSVVLARGSGKDPTEQGSGAGLVGFRIRELTRSSWRSGTDWTEKGLRNDPTEQELGN
ncbi:hypothetical protein B296_00013490 [Ensete ventricosum]|uniref:Uncharacterized protein n=1 Tax=Ensete ventricosum TaxID=4639 RepID=A0A426YGE8_ENSVE|nr:hypothetical protein B296_00013490 [Ensete ventricosum]